MSRLGREWERREEQRQQLLKQKVKCSVWSPDGEELPLIMSLFTAGTVQ